MVETGAITVRPFAAATATYTGPTVAVLPRASVAFNVNACVVPASVAAGVQAKVCPVCDCCTLEDNVVPDAAVAVQVNVSSLGALVVTWYAVPAVAVVAGVCTERLPAKTSTVRPGEVCKLTFDD